MSHFKNAEKFKNECREVLRIEKEILLTKGRKLESGVSGKRQGKRMLIFGGEVKGPPEL